MTKNSTFTIFKIVLLLLLAVAVLRSSVGVSSTVTFSSFLQYLSNAPYVDASSLLSYNPFAGTFIADLPLFGKVLSALISLFSVLLYAFAGIINVIIFVGYFLGMVFVF